MEIAEASLEICLGVLSRTQESRVIVRGGFKTINKKKSSVRLHFSRKRNSMDRVPDNGNAFFIQIID